MSFVAAILFLAVFVAGYLFLSGKYRELFDLAPAESAGAHEDSAAPSAENVDTLSGRFAAPDGFIRVEVEESSFAEYLRRLPLKPSGEKALLYDGKEKDAAKYAAVLDMDIGDRDLQQSPDIIIRLYAEYLFSQERFPEISFHFVSGFECSWDKWREGYRVEVNGNDAKWVKKAELDSSKESFSQYLDILYTYASTASLARELEKANPAAMKIGDVFVHAEKPGYAAIVADMAEDNSGEMCFLLIMGGDPAQQPQVLINAEEEQPGPWFIIPDKLEGGIETAEYDFEWDELMRFKQ